MSRSLIDPTTNRIVLHNSHLGSILSCAFQFEQVYIKGVPYHPNVPMVVGRAGDEVISANMQRKADKVPTMTSEEIQDVSTDTFRRIWNETPIWFDNEEREMGIEKVKEMSEYAVRGSATAYADRLMPTLDPMPNGVQWKWVIDCKRQYDFDLAGTADLLTHGQVVSQEGEPLSSWVDVRDLKVRKQKPSRLEVEHSRQFTVYAMGVKINLKQNPRYLWMDAFIKPTKTLDVRIESFKTTRTHDDYVVYQKILETISKMLQAGIFPPADAERPYAPCHRCSIQKQCPYYNGRKTISMSSSEYNDNPATEGEIHEVRPRQTNRSIGTKSGIIDRTSPEWGNLLPAHKRNANH